MRPYAVFLHAGVLEFLPHVAREKRVVLQYLRQLGKDPFQSGDYQEKDHTGRLLEVKVIAGYAIAFWADHAVCEVKVINLQFADRN